MNSVRRKGCEVRRTKAFTPYAVRLTSYGYGTVILFVALCVVLMPSCVRLSGGVGYSRADSEGNVKSKQAGFDTDDLVRKDKTPGSITV